MNRSFGCPRLILGRPAQNRRPQANLLRAGLLLEFVVRPGRRQGFENGETCFSNLVMARDFWF